MSEWFQCRNCGQIIHREILTANRCPFCGNDCLSAVVLKPRDVSPTIDVSQTIAYTQGVTVNGKPFVGDDVEAILSSIRGTPSPPGDYEIR